MAVARVCFSSVESLEEMFEEVTDCWGLSFSEREAVRGCSLYGGSGRRGRSGFLTERMALAVEIDWLLNARMDTAEIRLWLRRRVADVFGTSPLEDMVGSTDRLRRMRDLLSLEAAQ